VLDGDTAASQLAVATNRNRNAGMGAVLLVWVDGAKEPLPDEPPW
jgi:hypothetical protein